MLFQGQEFAASTPFLYFADHQPELSRLVAEGRTSFLSQFPSIADQESNSYLAPPHSVESFMRSKLDLSERNKNTAIYEMHRDLLKLRREDPVFSRPQAGGVDGAVLGPEAFVLRFFSPAEGDRLLVVNLGADLLLADFRTIIGRTGRKILDVAMVERVPPIRRLRGSAPQNRQRLAAAGPCHVEFCRPSEPRANARHKASLRYGNARSQD